MGNNAPALRGYTLHRYTLVLMKVSHKGNTTFVKPGGLCVGVVGRRRGRGGCGVGGGRVAIGWVSSGRAGRGSPETRVARKDKEGRASDA